MPNDAEIKPYHCRSCKKEVAQTDGIDLFFAGKIVVGEPVRVAFTCKFCGTIVEWNSGRKRKTVARL